MRRSVGALFAVLPGREDRVAVKPHSAPVCHAIQYSEGKQDARQAQGVPRPMAARQSYQSRDKDTADATSRPDRSAFGSHSRVCLVIQTMCAPSVAPERTAGRRMIARVGDAELDEGNVYE